MSSKKFVLFSNCIPVKGFNRSIVCDLQKNNYYYIPNGLYKILTEFNGQSIDHIKGQFNFKYDKIIDEYFHFLKERNLIFFTSNPETFPKINLDWDSPSLITNMIIDFKDINHDIESIIPQLETLKCSYIQLRFFRTVSKEYLLNLLEMVKSKDSRLVSIDLILPYDKTIPIDNFKNLIKLFPRVHSIVVFNAPFDKTFEAFRRKMGFLVLVQKTIIDERSCGKINEEYFYSNTKLFSESQYHNTCLNRKMSIDKDGNIKNCPSLPISYGNINDVSLIDALRDNSFKKYWSIKKDDIDVCKDCEFRHICTDCRAYVENPENIYSKPLKCGYNPYESVWENWANSPLKRKAIEHYDLKELV